MDLVGPDADDRTILLVQVNAFLKKAASVWEEIIICLVESRHRCKFWPRNMSDSRIEESLHDDYDPVNCCQCNTDHE